MSDRTPKSEPDPEAAGSGTAPDPILPPGAELPFVLLASCFLWWAIANNLTDPLVKVFKEIFGMSTFEASLIQMAFYGGYFCMALPGAMLARKFTYKMGVLVGLGVYALGCFLLYPAMLAERFAFFCLAYYVLACGLGVLETNANPYVLALGSAQTATRRLNFAQAFNPIGAVLGIVLCQAFVMARLPQDVDGNLSIASSEASSSLTTVIIPYLSVATVLVLVWIAILCTRMPVAKEDENKLISDAHSDGCSAIQIIYFRSWPSFATSARRSAFGPTPISIFPKRSVFRKRQRCVGTPGRLSFSV
ncbi:MAG: MFS transporter [Planctomycetota bacterium]